jgi:cytochrome oxidase Cu insertion factor (SCO1/SenC/PrrC family)
LVVEITMKRHFVSLVALLMLVMGSAFAAFAQGGKPVATPAPTPAPLKLKVGDVAPDFTLPNLKGEKVTLSSFRGKSNVVLAFYVFAFTGG